MKVKEKERRLTRSALVVSEGRPALPCRLRSVSVGRLLHRLLRQLFLQLLHPPPNPRLIAARLRISGLVVSATRTWPSRAARPRNSRCTFLAPLAGVRGRQATPPCKRLAVYASIKMTPRRFRQDSPVQSPRPKVLPLLERRGGTKPTDSNLGCSDGVTGIATSLRRPPGQSVVHVS